MKLPKYAYIDLSNGEISDYPISEELFASCLGGKIMAARLLYDLTEAGLDPLCEQSVIIVNTGPMNGTGAPSSSRFNVTFKNVMTGGIASSNSGGQFGVMLKRAGYDGLIITGRAEFPCCIEVTDGEIAIRQAPKLWGLDTEQVQEKFPKAYGKLVIGPAGENLVAYACAVSGERVAGRCGAGAVMGSKNLKAIVAYGTEFPKIEYPERFQKYLRKWVKFLKGHPMTGTILPTVGSAGLVKKANASHALPTRNFQSGDYEHADDISGETLAEKYLARNSGCVSCPIRCERRIMRGEQEIKGPEFETVGLLGSNICNNDLKVINELNYIADLMGLDTISLAGTIAFAMELKERDMADFGLEFGKTDNLVDAVKNISLREGKQGELALGSEKLAEKYGGMDFAIQVKGLELSSYEPRRSTGMGLGYAVSNRGGCHLNGGYLALLESVGVIDMDAQTPKGKPELTIMFQNAMEATSAAGFCLFTLQTMIPAFLFHTKPNSSINKVVGGTLLAARGALKALWHITPHIPINSMFLLPHCTAVKYATGIRMTTGKFFDIGERGYNIERLFNVREGFTAKDDILPKRLTDEPQVQGNPKTVVDMETMLPRYYNVRGWDKNGIPTEKRLKKLGLD
ncbi:MAG: aldehyde ferredoxin oxidoreductase family protein [Oscillospiraceae bacterium]